ncbi:hypothetical protein HanRHA438_Chr12g0540331 [Helianthus annuus]|nr:hypothetical protein HanRHA438_Chr12g0540331 [Helianthus annuus]
MRYFLFDSMLHLGFAPDGYVLFSCLVFVWLIPHWFIILQALADLGYAQGGRAHPLKKKIVYILGKKPDRTP